MSGQYATPLRLDLDSSRRLGQAVALLHGTALVILPFAQLPHMPTLLLALLVVLSWLRSRRRYRQAKHPDAVTTLVWGRAERVDLIRGSGHRQRARLLPRAFVQPWLVILHLRPPRGRGFRLLVLPDMLDEEAFRRLRVRLLLELHQATRRGGR